MDCWWLPHQESSYQARPQWRRHTQANDINIKTMITVIVGMATITIGTMVTTMASITIVVIITIRDSISTIADTATIDVESVHGGALRMASDDPATVASVPRRMDSGEVSVCSTLPRPGTLLPPLGL